MSKTVLGVFTEHNDAERAINTLNREGYDPEDISIVLRDKEEAEILAEDTGSNVVEGVLSGATAGAVLGSLAGLLTYFVLPGVGALFIGGPIAAVLGATGAVATAVSGAVTGAVAGGLIGALTNLGLTEDEARTYQEHIEEGAVLVAVPARVGEHERVEEILSNFNAIEVRSIDSPGLETRDRYVMSEDEGMFVGAKGGKSRRRRG